MFPYSAKGCFVVLMSMMSTTYLFDAFRVFIVPVSLVFWLWICVPQTPTKFLPVYWSHPMLIVFCVGFVNTQILLETIVWYPSCRVLQVEPIRTWWCLTKATNRLWQLLRVTPRRSPLSFTIHPRYGFFSSINPSNSFSNKQTLTT